MNLSDIYTELIMEHNQSKHNKGRLEDADQSARGHNPNCGDDLTVHIKVEEDRLIDIRYEGFGCAISEASASIMIDLIKGLTLDAARTKILTFMGMIKDEVDEEEALEVLEDASILANIKNMPARVKCAVLAWHALEEAMKKVG
ncbi:SUF system NifU family Fe-S cluster assembly protein [Petrocella atlantisensis]|uniref:SUF system NifU family Fe-S cluster assembly protein n=1 Tax=Petrocella atlantisensis TaxID=2173034 RepID=A0A3P7S0C4_9FIRM|nr:SUF system NifU family Fe-S cluster assembly protein [Petrocella atlantisensis]VDN48182.1 SUF system NifU family Fe-S cluster assembly protein [Petrocella atlantisensis]